ncbi:amino acid adenylation domain-containing protein [Cryobacterium sp. 1639]|uniref:non-ribosomal peptide synthetase n=1 Tax=Cryobacterium inferilacus TaxID=2866629 RepID=UPI001C73C278|nr:non-ribosomal peptide synthetase [Cryobacterium sp. 1639]MBX0301896.1 amino acid adenylation domain-containing protein [Cryobacterium sp. 1639]
MTMGEERGTLGRATLPTAAESELPGRGEAALAAAALVLGELGEASTVEFVVAVQGRDEVRVELPSDRDRPLAAHLADVVATLRAAGIAVIDGAATARTRLDAPWPTPETVEVILLDDEPARVRVGRSEDPVDLSALLTGRLDAVVTALVAGSDARAGRSVPLPRAEGDLLEILGTGPRTELRTTVVALVDAAIRADPSVPLLVDRDVSISYGEADLRVDAMSAVLTAAGIGAGDRVVICTEPSVDLVLIVLAVLRCGAAYVPVSPRDPADRRAFILAESGARAVIGDDDVLATAGSATFIDVTALRTAPASPRRVVDVCPDDAVYVMFTSGTTGRPKGVVLTHGGVANLITGLVAHTGMPPSGAVLFHTSFAFDASVSEMLLPAATGRSIAVARDGLDLVALADTIERHGVGLVSMVPSVLTAFLDIVEERMTLRTVTTFLSVGEALPPRIARRFHRIAERHGSAATLENMYGPTETSVFATGSRIGADAARVTLGRPLPNARVRLLEPDGIEPVGVGVPGEICIAGAGVASGYVDRPELTASRFIPDPLGEGPLYRTGDIGRWLPSGELDYLGRRDDQVKVRGQRIELGEIEEALAAIDGVRDAGCCVRIDDTRSSLHAFVVTDDAEAAERAPLALAAVLPARMLPASCTRLDKLPVNGNGKLDRVRLAALVPRPTTATGAPLTGETEHEVGAVVSLVLGIREPGADDSLLSLGGDSLTGVLVVGELRRRGRTIDLASLLAGRTLRECAAGSGRVADAPDPTDDEWMETAWIAEERRNGRDPRVTAAINPAPGVKVPDDIEAVLPLTAMQAGIVYTTMHDEDDTAFVVQQRYDAAPGRLSAEALLVAVRAVAAGHPALRVRIVPRADGGFTQLVLAGTQLPMVVVEAEDEAAAAALQDTDRRTPFRFTGEPLARVLLIETPERQSLILTYNHVILDGWSQDLLLLELIARHDGSAAPTGTPADRESTVRGYGGAVRAQVRAAAQSVQDEDGWTAMLAGFERDSTAVITASRSPLGDAIGSVSLPLTRTAGDAVTSVATRLGVTVSAVVESAWAVTLATVTGVADVLYGKTVTQRGLPVPGIAQVAGALINTVPARTRVEPGTSLAALVKSVHAASLSALPRAHAPLAETLRRGGLTAAALGTLYLYEGLSQARSAIEAAGLDLRRESTERTGFEVTLLASETHDGLLLTVLFDGRRFGSDDMSLLLRHLAGTLALLSVDPYALVGDVPTSLPDEATEAELWPSRPDARVDVAFRRVAARHPERPALVHGDDSLNYAQLDRASDTVAALLAAAGAGMGATVGLIARRSAPTLIAILGIVKAGAAYVPLDPGLPDERLRAIIEGSGLAAIAVVDDLARDRIAGLAGSPLVVDTRSAQPHGGGTRPVTTSVDGPVAVFHTSGTTGRPKGVVVPHRAVVRLVVDVDYVSLSPESVILQCASLAFDAATFEIWGAWLNGGALVLLAEDAHLDSVRLRAAITGHSVTHMWLTSSLFNMHVEHDPALFAGVKELLVGGERLSPTHIRRLHQHDGTTSIINGYGPTETGTFATTHRVGRGFRSIPIGRAVPRTGLHVVRGGRALGTGIPGELWVTGDGVALGYLDDPERTAERFVTNPFGSGLAYRTGDLVRRDADGTLDFLGRIDDQVKVRGHRVEPEEIVTALEDVETVGRVAVVARTTTTGATELVAFATRLTVDDAEPDIEGLRARLNEVLPSYAVPAEIRVLPALPLTATGKVDLAELRRKAAVPCRTKQDSSSEGSDSDAVTGRTGVERAVLAAYALALGATVTVDTRFLESGGDSLKAMRIVHLLRAGGYDVAVRTVLTAPTPGGVLAAVTEGAPSTQTSAGAASPDPSTAPELHPIHRGVYAACAADPWSRAYNVPFALICDGRVDAVRLAEVLTGIVARHPALRLRVELTDDTVLGRTTSARPIAIETLAYHPDVMTLIDSFARPFHLDDPPLLRAGIAASADHDVILLDVHHIAFDGTSLGILLDELTSGLGKGRTGFVPAPLPPSGAPERAAHRPDDLAHWLDVFDTLPEPATTMFGGSGSAETLAGAALTVPKELRAAVDALTAREGITPFAVYAAAVAALVQRYTMLDDVVIGVPVDVRAAEGRTGELGMWVNTVPLRLRPTDDSTLRSLLHEASTVASTALEHSAVPLATITSALTARHGTAARGLVEIALAFRAASPAAVDLGRTMARVVGPVSLQPKFAIEFTLERSELTDALGVEYRSSVLDADSAALLLDHLVHLVSAFAGDLDRPLVDIDFL